MRIRLGMDDKPNEKGLTANIQVDVPPLTHNQGDTHSSPDPGSPTTSWTSHDGSTSGSSRGSDQSNDFRNTDGEDESSGELATHSTSGSVIGSLEDSIWYETSDNEEDCSGSDFSHDDGDAAGRWQGDEDAAGRWDGNAGVGVQVEEGEMTSEDESDESASDDGDSSHVEYSVDDMTCSSYSGSSCNHGSGSSCNHGSGSSCNHGSGSSCNHGSQSLTSSGSHRSHSPTDPSSHCCESADDASSHGGKSAHDSTCSGSHRTESGDCSCSQGDQSVYGSYSTNSSALHSDDQRSSPREENRPPHHLVTQTSTNSEEFVHVHQCTSGSDAKSPSNDELTSLSLDMADSSAVLFDVDSYWDSMKSKDVSIYAKCSESYVSRQEHIASPTGPPITLDGQYLTDRETSYDIGERLSNKENASVGCIGPYLDSVQESDEMSDESKRFDPILLTNRRSCAGPAGHHTSTNASPMSQRSQHKRRPRRRSSMKMLTSCEILRSDDHDTSSSVDFLFKGVDDNPGTVGAEKCQKQELINTTERELVALADSVGHCTPVRTSLGACRTSVDRCVAGNGGVTSSTPTASGCPRVSLSAALLSPIPASTEPCHIIKLDEQKGQRGGSTLKPAVGLSQAQKNMSANRTDSSPALKDLLTCQRGMSFVRTPSCQQGMSPVRKPNCPQGMSPARTPTCQQGMSPARTASFQQGMSPARTASYQQGMSPARTASFQQGMSLARTATCQQDMSPVHKPSCQQGMSPVRKSTCQVDSSADKEDEQEAKRQRKRTRVIEELLHTEDTYQRHLQLVVQRFEGPLRDEAILPADIIVAIFSNLQQIIHINQELVHHLTNLSVGEAFLKLGPFLKLYSTYAKNHERALAVLMEWDQKSPEFSKFRRKQEEAEDMNGLKLNALLITPVQRIPRYKLLLEELLENTPLDHKDYQAIKEAVGRVAAVANHINNHIKQQDNFMKMLAIQKSLSGPAVPKLLIPGRMLIKDGTLKKVSKKGGGSRERKFFLFSDILMYAKPRLLESGTCHSYVCCCILPLQHCRVTRVFGHSQGQGALFNVKCKAECLLLFSDQKVVNSWIKALEHTISEFIDSRQTLRKVSSAKQPLRKAAIARLLRHEKQYDILTTAVRRTQEGRKRILNESDTNTPAQKLTKVKAVSRRGSPEEKQSFMESLGCLSPQRFSKRWRQSKHNLDVDSRPVTQQDRANQSEEAMWMTNSSSPITQQDSPRLSECLSSSVESCGSQHDSSLQYRDVWRSEDSTLCATPPTGGQSDASYNSGSPVVCRMMDINHTSNVKCARKESSDTSYANHEMPDNSETTYGSSSHAKRPLSSTLSHGSQSEVSGRATPGRNVTLTDAFDSAAKFAKHVYPSSHVNYGAACSLQ